MRGRRSSRSFPRSRSSRDGANVGDVTEGEDDVGERRVVRIAGTEDALRLGGGVRDGRGDGAARTEGGARND